MCKHIVSTCKHIGSMCKHIGNICKRAVSPYACSPACDVVSLCEEDQSNPYICGKIRASPPPPVATAVVTGGGDVGGRPIAAIPQHLGPPPFGPIAASVSSGAKVQRRPTQTPSGSSVFQGPAGATAAAAAVTAHRPAARGVADLMPILGLTRSDGAVAAASAGSGSRAGPSGLGPGAGPSGFGSGFGSLVGPTTSYSGVGQEFAGAGGPQRPQGGGPVRRRRGGGPVRRSGRWPRRLAGYRPA